MFSSGRLARLATLAALAAAIASTVLVSPAIAGIAHSSALGLEYSALAGETNRALLVWDGDTVLVSDPGAALVLGCMPRTLTEVRCPAPGRSTLSVLIDGGDGNDQLSTNRGTVVGGPGDDVLTGDVLSGGPGDDRLAGTDADNVLDGGPGADLLKGMGGTDRTTYADRAEGVRVTIDGRADDGAPGEGDDVETEDVNGGADPTSSPATTAPTG